MQVLFHLSHELYALYRCSAITRRPRGYFSSYLFEVSNGDSESEHNLPKEFVVHAIVQPNNS